MYSMKAQIGRIEADRLMMGEDGIADKTQTFAFYMGGRTDAHTRPAWEGADTL